ncbi:S26 family signal peptidase [Actinomadura mexicana]|uniref:signal peptidase I n=1 Tax=Actinomadura mexicana TaxID=134959 RepID=A0A238W4S5_9ACTN|nr:S26 family signal peptidase [Actinomadura mexicana]SNR41401.1 signal peptidase I [Actinomadura mexicana]
MTWLAAAGGMLLLAGALTAWVRRRYLVTTVDGPSMEPALHTGDRLLVRRTRRVRAGQIVVVRIRPPTLDAPPPDDPGPAPDDEVPVVRDHPDGLLYVKRAVAVAGDPVPVDRVPCLRETRERTVPPGALVVLGDNAATSWDSRAYGFVRADQFVGVAVRRLPAT